MNVLLTTKQKNDVETTNLCLHFKIYPINYLKVAVRRTFKTMLNPTFKIPKTLKLVKSLKTIRRDWKLKTPFQKWCYFYGIGKAPYTLLRIPLLNDVHNAHWFRHLLLVYEIVTILLSLYTILCWTSEGKFMLSWPSTCAASLLIGVCI